ncbi:MAG TPA: peroxiredoxin [Planctomycetota bacterium]|jgi:peroxiredoxin|nr:peroxiredoxin [Planctomycetota bacterium]
MDDFLKLPDGLPVPQDDGACRHLPGKDLPGLALLATSGREVRLDQASQSRTVFFFYPRTGRPGEPIPAAWDQIPGARGCTPHSCGYRDRFDEFRRRGIAVYGVSSQDTEYQCEFARRTKLPYDLLSDEKFRLTDALHLPTFIFEGARLIKRLAFVTDKGRIEKVFYPVFPPDQNAEVVLSWVRAQDASR